MLHSRGFIITENKCDTLPHCHARPCYGADLFQVWGRHGRLPHVIVTSACAWPCADEIHRLREREKELGIEPDWEIDAFMKASAARGKRCSIMTDYTMRILGLEVGCPSLVHLHVRYSITFEVD